MRMPKIDDLTKALHASADRVNRLKGAKPIHGRPVRASMESTPHLPKLQESIEELMRVITLLEERQGVSTAKRLATWGREQAAKKAEKDGKPDKAEKDGTGATATAGKKDVPKGIPAVKD